MALGRVFDANSPHNVNQLLRLAQDKRSQLFSNASVARRKQGNQPEPQEWLAGYLKSVYEPTPADFRSLRRRVQK